MSIATTGGRAVVALGAMLVTGGCATMTVGSYLERGYDLRAFRTYAWGTSDEVSTGDPRLDANPFLDERIRTRTDDILEERGYREVSADPDVLIHYHVSVTQKIDVRELDRNYGYCPDCEPFVYDAGTLFIDLVDPKTSRIIWRGWAEGSLDGVVDDQDWMNDRVDEAVERILRRLEV